MPISVDNAFVRDVLVRLVQTNSVNPILDPASPGEGAVAGFIAETLEGLGLETHTHEPVPGRVSVLGTLPGNGGGRALMLNAHIDTVGVAGMADPFSAAIEDGKLFGRGSFDMKGAMAACIGAAKALVDNGVALAGDLVIAGVADEEYSSIGTADVITRCAVDGAIVTEPTHLEVCLAHKGYVWLKVTTQGRAAHGSRFEQGVDANMHMGRVLAELETLERALRLGPAHPLVGPPAMAGAAAPRRAGSELLRVAGLDKRYAVSAAGATALFPGRHTRHLSAIADLDLAIRRGEIVALVGESGSGKTTLAKAIMGLEPASRGSIRLDGAELSQVPVARRTRPQRAALQMISQNPDQALNPSFSVGSQIARAVRRLSGARNAAEVRAGVLRLLDRVRLPPEIAGRLPRQLSGGQKQRVAVARALAGEPALLVADEPVSALDVSVRAAVIALFDDLRSERGTSILFISHDLAAVRHLADRVVVLFGGRIAEEGAAGQVFAPPHHPYTAALLAAIPATSGGTGGETADTPPPRAGERPGGCPYEATCGLRLGDVCATEIPPTRQLSPGHRIACHLPIESLPGP